MWVIFILSAIVTAIAALFVIYIGNKIVNTMKRDDYKLDRDINKYKNEEEKEKEKHE